MRFDRSENGDFHANDTKASRGMQQPSYILLNMLNVNHHRIEYFDDLTAAETRAVELLESSSLKWHRIEFQPSDDHFEFGRGGQVYIRVNSTSRVLLCDYPSCDGIATHEWRAGKFCDQHDDFD